MACTPFPDTMVCRQPKKREGRVVVAALSASAFSVSYALFLLDEASRPARSGSVALHAVGAGLALAVAAGAWGAFARRAWGTPLVAAAARGNLVLLCSAIAFAAWDVAAGFGGGDPIVALAALGAAQAATALLAAPRPVHAARSARP